MRAMRTPCNTIVDKIAFEAFEKQDLRLNRRTSIALSNNGHAYTPHGNAQIKRAFETRWGISDLKINVMTIKTDFSFTPSQIFIDDGVQHGLKRRTAQNHAENIERWPAFTEAYA